MDLFKLLTRSTKLKKNLSENRISRDNVIPSSGQNANPQLFGDEVAKKNNSLILGKRKRDLDTRLDDSITADIDFFANRNVETVSVDPSSESQKQAQSAKDDIPDEYLSYSDTKQFLKSHKIKMSSVTSKVRHNGQKPQSIYIQPLISFHQLLSRYNLRRKLMYNIDQQGYLVPTEIQLCALPLLMGETLHLDEKKSLETFKSIPNLLAIAPTGSGKTLSFLIPIINSVLSKRYAHSDAKKKGPSALVIAPTRELAGQIVNEGRKLALNTGIKVTLIKKGMRVGSGEEIIQIISEDDDIQSASEKDDSEDDEKISRTTVVKSDIIVATPLALLHALRESPETISTLPSVEHLVLDEADVLLDPLFKSQTESIWKACSNPSIHISFWSATMPSSIESLALSWISSSSSSSSSSSPSSSPTIRLVVGLKDSALSTISHQLVYAATEPGKLIALRQLLHPTAPSTSTTSNNPLRPPFLIFTQTIPRAIALHAELRYDIPASAGGSARIAVLHSGLSESARGAIMRAFRAGDIWVVVTTDLLARGVDFRGLNGVVNYDVPTSAAAYVHRAGRTGRAGRQGGVVVTLVAAEDAAALRPVVGVIRECERAAGIAEGQGAVKEWMMDGLPKISKRDKKDLKWRGVKERRAGNTGAVISTKVDGQRKAWNDERARHRERKLKNRKSSNCHAEADDNSDEFRGFD